MNNCLTIVAEMNTISIPSTNNRLCNSRHVCDSTDENSLNKLFINHTFRAWELPKITETVPAVSETTPRGGRKERRRERRGTSTLFQLNPLQWLPHNNISFVYQPPWFDGSLSLPELSRGEVQ
jgi:hypothetical protein